MRISSFLFLLLLALLSPRAFADGLVSYECDRRSDSLVLRYEAIDDSDSKQRRLNPDQWNPWSLISKMADENHIGRLRTVEKRCRLSDGKYDITISAVPGNYNIQGRCGAWMTASVSVRKGKQIILQDYPFERDCVSEDPITTRISIKAGDSQPHFVAAKSEQFYR